MDSVLLVVHVIIALAIVGLIMLQQGKGAEMGASFGGGSSQTVFGAAGSGNFFSRMTAILVAVFFATSLVLAVMSKKAGDIIDISVPQLETIQESGENAGAELPASDDIPVVDDAPPADEIPTVGSDEIPE